MKIRILGNSFRFRLKEPELEAFYRQKVIRETVEFGTGVGEQLTFQLEITAEMDFSSLFSNGHVIFFLPATVTNDWVLTNKTGFGHEIVTEAGKKLRLLVEKDFKCMNDCAEDSGGSYKHPLELADDSIKL